MVVHLILTPLISDCCINNGILYAAKETEKTHPFPEK